LTIQGRKALLARGAAALLVVGGVFGGLLVSKFFSSASALLYLPIPQLLAETHRYSRGFTLVDTEEVMALRALL